MIVVTINREPDGTITSFKMSGHANYADRGQDIVCAGASAVAFGAINAVISLTDVEPVIEQANSGYLTCSLPMQLSKEVMDQVQLLLEGMVVSLQTIERDYGQHIKVMTNQ